MQKLQPKCLKKYSIHTVKTEVCLCVLVCERKVCVYLTAVSHSLWEEGGVVCGLPLV